MMAEHVTTSADFGTMRRRLCRIARALDDHWLGDLIGVASLFAMLWVGLVAGWVLE